MGILNLDYYIEVWAKEYEQRNKGLKFEWIFPNKSLGQSDKTDEAISNEIHKSEHLKSDNNPLKVDVEDFQVKTNEKEGRLLSSDEVPLSQSFVRSFEASKTERQQISQGLQLQSKLHVSFCAIPKVLNFKCEDLVQKTDNFSSEKQRASTAKWSIEREALQVNSEARVQLQVRERVFINEFKANAILTGNVIVKFNSKINLFNQGKPHRKHAISICQLFTDLKNWKISEIDLSHVNIDQTRVTIPLSGLEEKGVGVNVNVIPINEEAEAAMKLESTNAEQQQQQRTLLNYKCVEGNNRGNSTIEVHGNPIPETGVGVNISVVGGSNESGGTAQLRLFGSGTDQNSLSEGEAQKTSSSTTSHSNATP